MRLEEAGVQVSGGPSLIPQTEQVQARMPGMDHNNPSLG